MNCRPDTAFPKPRSPAPAMSAVSPCAKPSSSWPNRACWPSGRSAAPSFPRSTTAPSWTRVSCARRSKRTSSGSSPSTPDPAVVAELERQIEAQRMLPAERSARLHPAGRTLSPHPGRGRRQGRCLETGRGPEVADGPGALSVAADSSRATSWSISTRPSSSASRPATPERCRDAIRRHLREVLSDLPEIVAACPDFFELPERRAHPDGQRTTIRRRRMTMKMTRRTFGLGVATAGAVMPPRQSPPRPR